MRVCQLPLACWTRIQLTPRSKVVPLAILRLPATLPHKRPSRRDLAAQEEKQWGRRTTKRVFFSGV